MARFLHHRDSGGGPARSAWRWRQTVANHFAKFSNRIAVWTGHYTSFMLALLVIVVWGATGPVFAFSDTWQLVINTGTTIVTFLMVFLIQNTQNRDALAVHLKLDELIRAIGSANNELITAEDNSEEELTELKAKYQALCHEHAELKGHYERLTTGAAQNGRATVAAHR
jgi:low affinity Fe/Cu permease